MKLSRHARTEILIALGLLLGSCDRLKPNALTDAQEDAVEAIAHDAALDAIPESPKFRDLEERVEALERKFGA